MKNLTPLPVDDFIEPLQKLLQENLNVVVTAAPGAGKTTRLPPALAKLFKGKTRVLEPRRMAAIAAAHRIAEENGFQVGQEVGYQVRFANKTKSETKLIFMTEALLARKLLTDPELRDTDLVILDEFHERSLHVDLALGLIRELQELGRDIRILVMSATLEAEKISTYLGGAPIVSVPGKLFPLEVHHTKESQTLQTHQIFFDRMGQVIRTAFQKSSRDLLVFLPGVGEIERLRNQLSDWAANQKVDIVPLHGSLKIEEQRAALKAGPNRRVLLSTNIAESSVTVDGVDTVIDSGLAKVLRQDPKTGFSRLELGRISLASAIQRAGRSARQYSGYVYRLWSSHDELNFPKSETPEVQRADLSESLLFLSAQGITQFQNFQWFEKPPLATLQQAETFLRLTGALDLETNHLTDLGRQLLHFPLPVRLAKIILSGLDIHEVFLASQVAALLQERDLLRRDQVNDHLGDQHESDLVPRLELLSHFLRTGKSAGASHFLLQTLEQSVRQIEDAAKSLPAKNQKFLSSPTDPLSEILLSAFADRLCRRRGLTERALMVGRRGVKLATESLVKKSEFFLALQGVEGPSDSETLVSWAHGISKELVFSFFSDKITLKKELHYNEERAQFYLHEFRCLFDLPLEEAKVVPANSTDVSARLPEVLRQRFDQVLKQNEEFNFWWQRLSFLLLKSPSINLDLEAFKLEAFQQACLGESNFKTVAEKDLIYFFESILNSDIRTLLKDLPDKLKVPSGSLIRIHYPTDKPPYIEVRIQEIFGLVETPKVLNKTLSLTFHLLGPNYRPVQLTSNLESFWKNGYPEVRKELRIKYPKHQWPEDPREGIPEAKGRKRH